LRIEDGFVVSSDRRISLVDLHAAGVSAGHRFEAKRKAYLSPRTTAFNVQGIRLAVHQVTGEIRILRSVHAADIGKLVRALPRPTILMLVSSPWVVGFASFPTMVAYRKAPQRSADLPAERLIPQQGHP
jgi:hypothetical protein